MHDDIRNIIIKTAKAVNALKVEDPDGNRIKHPKFRGMKWLLVRMLSISDLEIRMTTLTVLQKSFSRTVK